ncbi:hypothetical protein HPB51_025825 [Rhipicephalus microplus]|uniref:Uncharacterized protein n=1 Tax=Rhipicephalus microplus TaxID=6941 RepID=A0A9J6FA96_RHIMP|nr:hypothetical protein HPB51_025825 [Rhipicephalus microplus]
MPQLGRLTAPSIIINIGNVVITEVNTVKSDLTRAPGSSLEKKRNREEASDPQCDRIGEVKKIKWTPSDPDENPNTASPTTTSDPDPKVVEKPEEKTQQLTCAGSGVCERHFKPSDMVNTTSYTDTRTGKVIDAKLKLTRLRPDAVPSRILPNCPTYPSARAATASREASDEKKTRREAALLQDAINQSIAMHNEEERNNNVDTFKALLNCLPRMKASKFWTVATQHDCVLFLNLIVDDAPAIKKSVKITKDLFLSLFFEDVKVTKIDGIDIPETVNDMRCLTRFLEAVEQLDETS